MLDICFPVSLVTRGCYDSMAEQRFFFTWIFTPQESPFGALLAAERRSMAMGRNVSMTTSFILLGFSEHPESSLCCFWGSTPWLWLGTWASLSWSGWSHASILPCIFSLETCPLLTSHRHPPLSPRCSATSSSNRRQSPLWAVLLSFSSSLAWGALNAVSWRPWHITGMLPSPTLFSKQPSCHPPSAWGWSL